MKKSGELRNRFMWNQKLCLGTSDQFGVQKEEQIVLMKKTGFDGFLCMYENGKYRGRRISGCHMEKAECKLTGKEIGKSPELMQKVWKYHPYMRNRLSLRRLAEMIVK